MSELGLDDLTEDWAAMKLIPRRTGLSRAVWITEDQGYQHDGPRGGSRWGVMTLQWYEGSYDHSRDN